MNPDDEKINIIEKALKYAFRKGHDYQAMTGWERRVMSHVLSLDVMPMQTGVIWNAPALWRTALAFSISAVIVLAYSFVTGIGPEYEAARFLTEDPMGFIFAQPLFP